MSRLKGIVAVRAVGAAMLLAGTSAWAQPAGDVVVVDRENKYAFVGWHGAFEFPATDGQAWTIFLDIVKEGVGGADPSLVDILLFTADGTSNPDNPGNLDAGTIYNRLSGEGYNLSTAVQSDIAIMTDFSVFDIVIYPNLQTLSAANVVASGVPFLSMEPYHSLEMSIGTGISVFDDWAQYFYLNEEGEFLAFDHAVRTEAITAARNGVVLVSLSEVPEPGTMLLVLSGMSGLAWLRRRRSA